MLNEFSKKEAPIQGLAGMGGGVPSRLLTLASGEVTYVDDVFSTYVYAGNNTLRSIQNGIDLAGEGGLVWIKNRESGTQDNVWCDTVRGGGKILESNNSNSEFTSTARVDSFLSDGFKVGTDNATNDTGNTQISWTFRKCRGFFDIVTYTGNGVSGRTISHNLGSVPGCIMIKCLDVGRNWTVYHRGLDSSYPQDKYIFLNDSTGSVDNSSAFADTAPTATEFTLGTYSATNGNGSSFIAYIFAHNDGSFGEDSDEAVIKCDSYTGSGSQGKYVELGFEPQWLMIKRTAGAGAWKVVDEIRGMHVGSQAKYLTANEYDAEFSDDNIEPGPTGFTLQTTGSDLNSNNERYIYMAIRRPHKPPESATDVFAIDQRVATKPNMVSNFVTDAALRKPVGNTYKPQIASRLTGPVYLRTSESDTELNFDFSWDYMNGFHEDATQADSNIYSWMFKRAPGFFDVVVYSGSSSVQNISHNLEVEPELMLIKNRDRSVNWEVYNKPSGNTKYMQLNGANGHIGNPAPHWNQTTPTSTQFTVGTNAGGVNYDGDSHIAYLFASLDGISKVGSYSGSSSDVTVDCGFTNGARFVLIKRTNDSGEWFVYDSTRGLTTNTDPYIRLNTSSAQATESENWVESHSSGFKVNSTAPSDLNGSGNTYLFLAIA